MNSTTDLTLFWRAWQKTCSVRLCCAGHDREYLQCCSSIPELCEKKEEVQSLAREVIASMNRHFAAQLKKNWNGARLSDYSTESTGWNLCRSQGSAFELLESHLYNRQFLKGRAFKAYLFEDVARRPGGMNRNLFGYLQRVLATIAADSYGENLYQPQQDEAGNDMEPTSISLDGHTVVAALPTAEEYTEAREVEDVFCGYLIAHGKEWSSDHWLILYCVLNLLRVGASDIRALFSKGHQTINVWTSQMKSDLLCWLRERFSDKAIGMALAGRLQSVLDKKVCEMAWYPRITEILEENRKSTGK